MKIAEVKLGKLASMIVDQVIQTVFTSEDQVMTKAVT